MQYLLTLPMMVLIHSTISCGGSSPVSIHRRQVSPCSLNSGSSKRSDSQNAFRIMWNRNPSWCSSAPNAKQCEFGLQSGCPSFTPCQWCIELRINVLRLVRSCPCSTLRRSRRAISSCANRRTSPCLESSVQSNQLVSLSRQYALLLPHCERRTSSPIRIIGCVSPKPNPANG